MPTPTIERERGIPQLLSSLADGFSKLVSHHIALAKLEVAQDAKAMAGDAGRIAAFVPFVLIGYVLLCVALAALLSRWIGMAGGFAVVGAANLLGGGIGIAVAISRLRRRQVLDESRDEINRSKAALAVSTGRVTAMERSHAG